MGERCRSLELLRAKLADARHGAFAVRILHLTTEFPPIIYGGLGTATGGLVRALAKSGIETAVFLFGPSSGAATVNSGLSRPAPPRNDGAPSAPPFSKCRGSLIQPLSPRSRQDGAPMYFISTHFGSGRSQRISVAA